jgi:hypothetical protein
MKVAPIPQAMEREAKPGPVSAGKARSGPASGGPKPLVQSQEEAVAFGERFWAQYDSKGKPPGDGEIYFKPEKMYSLLRQGSDGSPAPVRLLRLSWLLKQARRGAVLPRRQELPEEAFLSEAEVRALPRGHVGESGETCGGCCLTDDWRADKPLRIIAISYGWLTPEHPDPDGEQLARFAEQIERERRCCPVRDCFAVGWSLCWNALCLGIGTGYCCYVIPCFGQQCGDTAHQLPSGEFGVFYDWGSLHQKDADGQRTEPEQAAFKTALKTVNTWYAHRLTTTVILSELPPGWPRSPEDAPLFPEGWLRGKGWPVFERAVSGFVKRGAGFSFRRIADPAVPRGVAGGGGYRAPPMHPREFAAELSRKVFTNGADCEVVARLYADACCAALGEARVLEFSLLQWNDEDAEAFAKVLPLLRRVETLDLSNNKIGTRGFAALAAAIREGAAPALEKFLFAFQTDGGDSTALHEACKARGISRPLV